MITLPNVTLDDNGGPFTDEDKNTLLNLNNLRELTVRITPLTCAMSESQSHDCWTVDKQILVIQFCKGGLHDSSNTHLVSTDDQARLLPNLAEMRYVTRPWTTTGKGSSRFVSNAKGWKSNKVFTPDDGDRGLILRTFWKFILKDVFSRLAPGGYIQIESSDPGESYLSIDM